MGRRVWETSQTGVGDGCGATGVGVEDKEDKAKVRKIFFPLYLFAFPFSSSIFSLVR
ncbi:MAG: hypothetical protein ACHBN1_09885 [Heteroscytonema crispum UTEX LB 1556]